VVSPSGNLYISDSQNHRIQVFSLKGFVLRDIWGKPGTGEGEFNEPWDITMDSKGHIYVVDKGNHRIQKFTGNRVFMVEFGQAQLSHPKHIAVDTHDRIHVIDDADSVKTFSTAGDFLGQEAFEDETADAPVAPPIWVDYAGRVHYDIRSAIIQPHFFSHKDYRTLGPFGQEKCLTLFEGVIPGLYFEKTGKLVFDAENMPQPVIGAVTYKKEGIFYTQALDSQTYKCQWHKVLLDADLPAGTTVTVDTYSAASKKDFLEVKSLPSHLWLTRQVNARNFLVQSLPGRYLWLKFTIKGNGQKTPLIKNIQVIYPRRSYLQYLPAIFQEDPQGKWFMERFLSIFEHFFAGFEDEIADMTHYFNPLAVEKEFLPWLASWLGLTLDATWPGHAKRELLKKAPHLFEQRGTPKGLQMVLEIYTGMKFPILEHFKLRRWLILGDSAVLGCNSLLWGKEASLGESTQLGTFKLGDFYAPPQDPFMFHAHRFTVIIPYTLCNTPEKERMIKRIVELWKPAHTQFFLRKVTSEFRVGLQSIIGADTIIGKYPQAILGRKTHLGKESILGTDPSQRGAPGFRLNYGTRLNKSSLID
jgi:phage tail-like protein